MTVKTIQHTPTGININFYHFYPSIVDYLDTATCCVKRDIRCIPIGELTDIVFDWLLNRVGNFTVTPCPWSWRLYRYFDKEDAIEIFDELFLDFIDFLREQGIDAKKHYEVKRGKHNRCSCITTAKVTPNFQ